MAIYFLFGSGKESFVELCSRTQNPTVSLTVRASCLFHTTKVFQRAASWSDFDLLNSECSIVSVVSLNLPFHLRKLRVIYLLEQRGRKHSCSQVHQSVQMSSSYFGKSLVLARQEGKVLPHPLNFVSLRPVMWIPMMLPLTSNLLGAENLCIGVYDLLYFCLGKKSLFFG